MVIATMPDMDNQHFSANILRAYFDSSSDAIFVLSDKMAFLACNKVMQDWLGMSEAQLVHEHPHTPVIEMCTSINKHGVFEANFVKALAGESTRFVVNVCPPENVSRWLEISLRRVDDPSGEMVIAVARDISDRMAYLEVMERQATIDSLTGLANRQVFRQHISSMIANSSDTGRFAVALLDIDRFRDINESLGYPLGDQVLKLVGDRFREYQQLHHDIYIAGLGGDSFGIVFSYSHGQELGHKIENLQSFLSQHLQTRAGELILDFTIGIAFYPEHARDAEDLLHRAESALHSAKTQHSRLVTYHPSHQVAVDHVMLRVHLEQAINAEAITPYYQPIVHSKSGGIRLELLSRWQHEQMGNIDPGIFIPLAEHTGLINRMTLSILKQALRDCADLIHQQQIQGLSLNLSPYSLHDVSLPGRISDLLQQHGLQPQQLLLELTESAIIPDSVAASLVMKELGNRGFHLAIDDFGTGHSSLVRLKLLPISELKIDKSFVEFAHNNMDDQEIVRAAVTLAHNLKLQVVAEGISSSPCLQLLSSMGCDYLQGFLFSRPAPVHRIPAMLDSIRNQYKNR